MRQDPHLRFLDLAWSPPRMADVFSRRVLPALDYRREVASAAIETMTYTPGRDCVVLYSLRFTDRQSLPLSALATFAKDGETLEDAYVRHYETAGTMSEGAFGRAVLLPEYPCLVEFFPGDWRLPSLARAAEGGLIAPFLTGPSAGAGSTPHVDVMVLRYRPHLQCLFLYGAKASRGTSRSEVIGKIYKEAFGAAQVAERQEIVRRQAAASGLVVPEPLAVLPALNLLLMERVSGRRMKDVLERSRSDGREQFLPRRAAAALAILHDLQPPFHEERSLTSELERIRTRVDRLQLVVPLLARRMNALLDRIVSAARETGSGPRSLVHGDFKPSQLLMDKTRVAVVDFDRVCLGDPALDVGNFMAQFRKEARLTGRDALRELARPFFDEYRRHAPADGLAERARLYEALALVRMADRRFRLDPPSYAASPSASLPALLLDEAADCLSRGEQ